MKDYAQEILQFSGYPLEPIVAREVKKQYDAKLKTAVQKAAPSPYAKALGINDVASNSQDWDTAWFNHYE